MRAGAAADMSLSPGLIDSSTLGPQTVVGLHGGFTHES